ncbi:hypothetical protein [Bifidobacterium dentium]|jgi:hypothetical protein|uniref:hypothetical protein n=1 Tax=Bifidobacterium dentium TaxID=1689 RepID=UPI0026DC6E00|nr:hypothetical protein [Bifidobacterium dentium]
MIFDDGKPIGMARLLGDYAMAYLIKDVAGLSEYQHRGSWHPTYATMGYVKCFKSSHMPRGFSGKRNGTLRI